MEKLYLLFLSLGLFLCSNASSLDLASLSLAQGFTIAGYPGTPVGYPVSYAGDMNKDGYADILLGAYRANSDVGQVYVIFGGTNLNNINLASFSSTQGFIISNLNTPVDSGTPVRYAGDVNGDGYSDIIIGSYSLNADAGKSYVIYGGSSLSNIDLSSLTTAQGFIISGTTSTRSGWSVSGAGDVNKDGYDDVIIGGPSANSNNGIAYIIYGGINLNNIDIATLTSSQGISVSGGSGSFGNSVSQAGDVNHDGYADVVIGAVNADSNAGKTYVIYGGASLTNINLASLTPAQGFSVSGAAANDGSGVSVSYAGDVNNDNYDDILIGANSAGNGNGKSYIIYGGNNINNIALLSLTNSQGIIISGASNDNSGISVSYAGDINHDGYDDIIIGANSVGPGRVYVIFGKNNLVNLDLSSLSSSDGFSIVGATNGDSTGYSVSYGGDVNGDTYTDIVIFSCDCSANSGLGKNYVVYGGMSGFITYSPSPLPTISPTYSPSDLPTHTPSALPTLNPSFIPTILPTLSPTAVPSFSVSPTVPLLPISEAIVNSYQTRASIVEIYMKIIALEHSKHHRAMASTNTFNIKKENSGDF
jgi:hypothetical protein